MLTTPFGESTLWTDSKPFVIPCTWLSVLSCCLVVHGSGVLTHLLSLFSALCQDFLSYCPVSVGASLPKPPYSPCYLASENSACCQNYLPLPFPDTWLGGYTQPPLPLMNKSQIRNSINTHEEHVPARMTPANSSAGGTSASQMVEARRDNSGEVPVESKSHGYALRSRPQIDLRVILSSNVPSAQEHSRTRAVWVYIKENVGGAQAVQATLQQWSLHFWLRISPVTARLNTTMLSCGAML